MSGGDGVKQRMEENKVDSIRQIFPKCYHTKEEINVFAPYIKQALSGCEWRVP
jgi:hypothetical protein